jgi:hypothetical protein
MSEKMHVKTDYIFNYFRSYSLQALAKVLLRCVETKFSRLFSKIGSIAEARLVNMSHFRSHFLRRFKQKIGKKGGRGNKTYAKSFTLTSLADAIIT